MIYILTGAIRTGKTSALLDWCKTKNDVDGVLCPDDDNGKRYFLEIKNKNVIELETDLKTEDIIEIGNFKFLKSAFDTVNDYLVSITSEIENQYVIIDELGKLELKKEGLHLSSETLISQSKSHEKQHLILVVRDYLFDSVLKHYAISEYSILKTEDLKYLI